MKKKFDFNKNLVNMHNLFDIKIDINAFDLRITNGSKIKKLIFQGLLTIYVIINEM